MKNSTKALQMLKEKISKLEIHILFLYGLIFFDSIWLYYK